MLELQRAIHNERIKLIANSLDRGSTGSFITGVVIPLTSYLKGDLLSIPSRFFWPILFGLIGWTITGFGLHYFARKVLGELK